MRILIVDDQASFRHQLSRLLAYAGMEVIGEAGTIREAERFARAQQPDLAVVDVMLPEISGMDGVPVLKAAAPGMRVILVSAYRDRAHLFRQAAQAAGAEAFFSKDELDFQTVSRWKEGGSKKSIE